MSTTFSSLDCLADISRAFAKKLRGMPDLLPEHYTRKKVFVSLRPVICNQPRDAYNAGINAPPSAAREPIKRSFLAVVLNDVLGPKRHGAGLRFKVLVCRAWLIKKQLYFAKKLDAILLQKNEVSALPNLHKTFILGVGEFAEDRLRPCDQGTAIPLCEHN
jgi:hypothetical protein